MKLDYKFHSEIYRPLMMHFVPGLIASLPYLYLFRVELKDFLKVYSNNVVTPLLLSILILALGHILENFGSEIEANCFDESEVRLDKKKSVVIGVDQRKREWNQYLSMTFNGSIGHHYLKKILVRMKLELSLIFASIAMSIGLFIISFEASSCNLRMLSLVSLFVAPAYFYREARQSSDILARVRHLLVQKNAR